MHHTTFRTKSQNCKLRLFESLVKSVLMYCSLVWGVFTAHSFEVFYNDFPKYMLSLPRFTPNWFVHLETQCKRIEISYVKNIALFLCKIMSREKSSLIFQCFNELRKTESKLKMKWSNLFSKHNTSHLLELNAEDQFDVSFFKSQLNSSLSEIVFFEVK
jgi:hypothetical protein